MQIKSRLKSLFWASNPLFTAMVSVVLLPAGKGRSVVKSCRIYDLVWPPTCCPVIRSPSSLPVTWISSAPGMIVWSSESSAFQFIRSSSCWLVRSLGPCGHVGHGGHVTAMALSRGSRSPSDPPKLQPRIFPPRLQSHHHLWLDPWLVRRVCRCRHATGVSICWLGTFLSSTLAFRSRPASRRPLLYFPIPPPLFPGAPAVASGQRHPFSCRSSFFLNTSVLLVQIVFQSLYPYIQSC